MAIRKIPKDTPWFHYHNENPKDNRAADCVIRSIAAATSLGWDKTYDGLCEEGRKLKRVPNERQCYEKYLARLGWVKHKQPKRYDGTKYTGKQFIDEVLEDGVTAIAHIGGHHVVAIIDGRVHDTWDCTNRCIGNYWTYGY